MHRMLTQVQKEAHLESIDLNETLQGVLNDLELVIQTKGAQIKTNKLPVIKGQVHQVQQLVYNLVQNAFKVIHNDRIPETSIMASTLPAAPIPKGLSAELDYTEIVVKNNGIGFENMHAEKVFIIFQRLHYRAEAVPGEGATFRLILPVA